MVSTAVAVLEYAEERYERMIEIIDAVPPGQPRGPEDPSSDVADTDICDPTAEAIRACTLASRMPRCGMAPRRSP